MIIQTQEAPFASYFCFRFPSSFKYVFGIIRCISQPHVSALDAAYSLSHGPGLTRCSASPATGAEAHTAMRNGSELARRRTMRACSLTELLLSQLRRHRTSWHRRWLLRRVAGLLVEQQPSLPRLAVLQIGSRLVPQPTSEKTARSKTVAVLVAILKGRVSSVETVGRGTTYSSSMN